MLASRSQADELPVINMTPMVNVILCLLVFFMAATRLYDWDENEFVVKVPEVVEAAPLTAAPDDLVLTVVKPGVVAVGESTYDLDGLVKTLREAKGHYVNQGVVIRADASLVYQDLADVLSACDAAGIRNVRLPVRSRDEAIPSRLPRELPSSDRWQRRRAPPRSELRSLVLPRRRAAVPIGVSDGIDPAALRYVDPPQPGEDQRVRPRRRDRGPLRRPLPDHLRRDGSGRDPVLAGRFAALRRRRRDGTFRFADPAVVDDRLC